MENEYRRKYEKMPAESPPRREGEVPAPKVHHKIAELRSIGEQCSTRLPPASAMQAMFLYEMQRETELEKLFHGQMFRLACGEAEAADQSRRIDAIETRMAQMEKQAASREVEDRLATSKTALNIQQGKINTCSTRVDGLDEKFAGLASQLEALRAAQEAASAATPEAPADDVAMDTIKEELNVLFDDRDGILSMLEDIKTRVANLEGNVRALTLQGTAVNSPRSNSPQVLPVQTTSGKAFDLAVPKGHPHVPFNSSSSVRSFSPGKQWGQ